MSKVDLITVYDTDGNITYNEVRIYKTYLWFFTRMEIYTTRTSDDNSPETFRAETMKRRY